MKLHYYADTDSLYIELRSNAGVEAYEIANGVNIDVTSDGAPVGVDIERASMKLDLTTLKIAGLPFLGITSGNIDIEADMLAQPRRLRCL